MEQTVSSEERNWALFCHLAALAIVVPYIGFIACFLGPLVVWLVKRNEFPLVDDQGKESLNFQITMALVAFFVFGLGVTGAIVGIARSAAHPQAPPILAFASWLGMFVVLGLIALADIISVIVAAVKTSAGERYRYPIAIRFIR